jgi:chromosome segregation ATPase
MGLFDDLDNLKDKFDTVIDESTNKYLKIKSKLAELTEAHHKCKARHTIFKHNELKNEERFKRLESELEQERLLRKNLERQYDELFCLVHEKLKL